MMNKTIYILSFLLLAVPAVANNLEKQYNTTPSPDSTKVAYTLGNNLYCMNLSDSSAVQCTSDGTDVILNGYSSWVYFEEIFGRYTNYKAFWWSPDSKKIAFFRFDETEVPMFPIYHIGGQDGFDVLTRYPKAGENNPKVRIGVFDLEEKTCTWFDYPEDREFYYGTPFWSDDSKYLYIQRMPRVQQNLELIRTDVSNASWNTIYTESYKTWIDWMDDMLFGKNGLYMVRSFETGWQQIYYLSYDGSKFKQLTKGPNWAIQLLGVDEKKGEVYFTAQRDSRVHSCLYKINKKGTITALSPIQYHARITGFEPDYSRFEADLSNLSTPVIKCTIDPAKPGKYTLLQNTAPEGFDISVQPHYELISLDIEGMTVPGCILYPKNFDPGKKYPLVMEIYGGPGTQYVRDQWRGVSPQKQWFFDNGYIHAVVDSRVAGHNGQEGMDLSYRNFVDAPVHDFKLWAEYFAALPYVGAIGVEGYSFGGTNATQLVFQCPDLFACGVAGGGVYDWMFYDSHYTERYMDTPARNAEGYSKARVLNYVENYDDSKTFLKLAAGTADDNVHFQSTLELIDALQKAGKHFDLMIYPNGYHGCRGQQAIHDYQDDRYFWNTYLKTKVN